METITIITPTFNREEELTSLYKSLLNQTCRDFIWMVIDDGSIDNTKNVVENYKKENKINIVYKYKKNGGKHTALNMAFSILETELEIIVDSDDVLTSNAIERILEVWKKYKKNKKLCGMVFKKKDIENNKEICNFKEYEFIENYNKYIVNQNIIGDKAEIFRSNIIKNYQYPEFKGEKFIGEGVLWSQISHKYDMIFVNESIYLCRYLEGGLTKSGRKLRIDNPKGGMYHAKEFLDKIYSFKTREKNAILYLVYSWFAKMNFKTLIKKNKKNKILLILNVIPSFIIYKIWKFKYE